jgi:hypothetical protein
VRNEINARQIVDRIQKNLGVLYCLLLPLALTASTSAVKNTVRVITTELGEKVRRRSIADTERFEFFGKFFARQRTQ